MNPVTCTAFKPEPVQQVEAPPYCKAETPTGVKLFLLSLETWKLAADKTHEDNQLAIEHNKEQSKAVGDLLAALGITGYSEVDRKSRSRYPKRISHPAGYHGDLIRTYLLYDGYESQVREYSDRKRRAEELLAKLERKSVEDKERQEREQRANESLIKLGKLAAKYNADVSSWGDMFDYLREKDKYIDLAAGMEATRCSWADGPGKARDALQRFTVESDADKQIWHCVSECFDDFCDGRVFRDCEWNYTAIYQLADAGILADFRVVQENLSDWWE